MTFKKYMISGLGFVFAFALVVAATGVHTASASASSVILNGPDMTVGSTGSSVSELQGILSELGYLQVPVGIPFGYFGSLTQSAVARYQAANGVTPTAGYYGPVTRASVLQMFTARGWMQLLTSAGL